MEKRQISTVAQSSYFAKIYGYMTAALLVTALTAFYVSSNPSMVNTLFSGSKVFILLILQVVLVGAISGLGTRISPSAAMAAFFGYSVLNGITLSAILLVYTGESIGVAFVTAAVTFGVMSVFGIVTKRDLSKMGSLLFMALIGIILSTVLNMFLFKSSALELGISVLGVLIFTGLTAYDTQKLKKINQQYGEINNMAIIGALTLYLDFINLFLYLLRFLGIVKGRD